MMGPFSKFFALVARFHVFIFSIFSGYFEAFRVALDRVFVLRLSFRGEICGPIPAIVSRATRSASRLERGEWVDGVAAESIGVAGAPAGRRCAGGTAPRYAMISHAVLPVSSAAA